MWSLHPVALLTLLLSQRASVVSAATLQFDAPDLISWVNEDTREAVLQVRVTNIADHAVDMALSFNQTFPTDATAVPSPGDSAYSGLSSAMYAPLDMSRVDSVISQLLNNARTDANALKTLVIPIVEDRDDVTPHMATITDCIKNHGSQCEHTAWRADSKCRPGVRIMAYLGLIALDYDSTITDCTHEDISADIAFLRKYFTLIDVELDEEEPDIDEEEYSELQDDSNATSFLAKDYTTPNDPYFDLQWHLDFLNITETWKEIGRWPTFFKPLIAVVDSGVHFDHPDLQENLWINEVELNGLPGVDDDGNGYVDDIYGWVVKADGSKKPVDHSGHGTHVLGIISATVDNGIGVASVAGPHVTTAVCRRRDWSGSGATSYTVECKDWAIAIGAHFSTNSYGSFYTEPQKITSAKKRVYAAMMALKQVCVTSAGNDAAALGPPVIDGYHYDGCYNYPFMVTVGNAAMDGGHHYNTNYGENCVTVAAPGQRIYSTADPDNAKDQLYIYKNGTSMATPVISGILALWLNVNPYLDAYEQKRLLRESIVPYPLWERPASLFGGIPSPLKGVRLLRPETLKPADGSRWDDYRFNLQRLQPGQSKIYHLRGRIDDPSDTVIGEIIAYDVDFYKNYAINDLAKASVTVRTTPDSIDDLTIDDFTPRSAPRLDGGAVEHIAVSLIGQE